MGEHIEKKITPALLPELSSIRLPLLHSIQTML